MTFEDFDSTFRNLGVMETYILPIILMWYHANRNSAKPSKLPPFIIGIYFCLAGLYAGILFLFVQRGWMFRFRFWLYKIYSVHWRYDWYCGIIFLLYFGCGAWILYQTFRPERVESKVK